jgi:hypothetical protein
MSAVECINFTFLSQKSNSKWFDILILVDYKT